ncbi:MAG: L,D-transpeptidase [Alphaproteobacteria bacterium]|nr:L,D-transpeptidase [Alphaproteobacteria bacterium]
MSSAGLKYLYFTKPVLKRRGRFVPDFVRFGACHLARAQAGFKIGPVLLATLLSLSLSVDAAQARSRKHAKSAKVHKTALASPIKETEPAPKGPLTIVVSIAKQSLTLYDGFEPIATTPVSTGVPGHETPMGLFSIIQKDRFHRSNLYGNAPMPYMQRITWSGVALHEGHVTGRVASHGCVRLPQAFAQRLWGLTKLGARVIIAQDDVSLAEMTAPALLAARPLPQLQIVIEPLPDLIFPADWQPALPTPVQDADVIAQLPLPIQQDSSIQQDSPSDIVLADATAAIAPSLELTETTGFDLGPLPPQAPIILQSADLTLAQEPIVTLPAAPLMATGIAAQDLAFPEEMKLVEIRPAISLDPKAGPLAILISKREGKLMIRQNFKPVYETSVQFEPGEDLLGTHLYSALGATDTGLRWSSVTLPSAQAIQMERERLARPAGRKNNKGVQLASRSDIALPEMFLSAEQALQKVRIPDEAANLIAAALTPGSSLIITDLSQSHETGRGTDFIVQAR